MQPSSWPSSLLRTSGAQAIPPRRPPISRPVPRPSPGAWAGLAFWFSLALALVAGSRPAAAAPAAAPSELVRMRWWTAPEHTRLVFDLTGPAPPQTRFRMVDSMSFECFLPRVRKSAAVTTEFVGDSLIADILPAVSDAGTSLRVRLKKRVTPLGFVLAAADGVPDRVVVDVPMPVNPAADQALDQRVSELKKAKNFIVAIDAGHGGEDPGAIGHRRTQEADITLAIAKKLKNQLEELPGINAVLTRTDDYFIPLRKRVDIARRYQADLFVSIHCNASRDRNATGTEIYFL